MREKTDSSYSSLKSVNIAYEANLLLPTVLQKKINKVNILEGSYALARQQIQFKLQKRILSKSIYRQMLKHSNCGQAGN